MKRFRGGSNNNNNNASDTNSSSPSNTSSSNTQNININTEKRGEEKKIREPPKHLTLEKGEEFVLGIENIKQLFAEEWYWGVLCVTSYRIVFMPFKVANTVLPFNYTEVPLMSVHKVNKDGGKKTRAENGYSVELHCKDFREIRLAFDNTKPHRKELVSYLRESIEPSSIEKMFCFYAPREDNEDEGWNIYHVKEEFERQGALLSSMEGPPAWRLTGANANFKICGTYARHFCVPASITDEELVKASAFRSRERIPSLSWFNIRNGSSLTRSSQPLSGFFFRKSNSEDTLLIDAITNCNRNNPSLRIVDLRPRVNAEVNRFLGKGYETASSYQNSTFEFRGIDNIHTMRDSYSKLLDLCVTTGGSDEQWLSKLEKTDWLSHIRTILIIAVYVAFSLEKEKISVHLHCSDGWDRTAQICSLAPLMLDPYYRTIKGFTLMIDKEWLSFGHKFQSRCSHGKANFWAQDVSPVFLQFMDAVHQLLYQFPSSFEFTEDLLLVIMDHVFSCRFGTFLCDNVAERIKLDLPNRTPSLWTYLLNRKERFKNPVFDDRVTCVFPNTDHASIRFWDAYFLRHTLSKERLNNTLATSPHQAMVAYCRDVMDVQQHSTQQ